MTDLTPETIAHLRELDATEINDLRYEAGIILTEGPNHDDEGTPCAEYVVADGLVRALDEVSRLRAELTICERTSQRNAEAHMAEHNRANDNARKLAATRERAEKAERELAAARAVIERVTALADGWDRFARGVVLDVGFGARWNHDHAQALRATLAPVTQREEGE